MFAEEAEEDDADEEQTPVKGDAKQKKQPATAERAAKRAKTSE